MNPCLLILQKLLKEQGRTKAMEYSIGFMHIVIVASKIDPKNQELADTRNNFIEAIETVFGI